MPWEVLQKRLETQGIDVDIRLLQGDPASDIENVINEYGADLVIMGSHKRGFFSGLLNDNTEKTVLKTCSCPILLVPEICTENKD